ncbi:hypothetical protein HPB50_000399 [Hyalomma asiaticum]|uniref:Uncharacterized protein n=1 Tax=Hyalomma asiaticum TaxID=266040 RepID=A0ACB7SA25_HYAAI|nr:hypothetical protein HPB50_000399 [Hyalomma asiaticum]
MTMMSGAELRATEEVYSPGLLATLVPSFETKEERGVAYEASITNLLVSQAVKIPLFSQGFNVSVWIGSLKWRLELLVDEVTGEATFRDFQVLHLGCVTVKTEGLWYLDYIAGPTLTALLAMAPDAVQRIGEHVGRRALHATEF